MRFKTFIEVTYIENGKWATVKKIPVGTVSKQSKHVVFGKDFEKLIGKHLYFRPIIHSPNAAFKDIWRHKYTDYTGVKHTSYFDPAWLAFDKEEDPYLFPKDPE